MNPLRLKILTLVLSLLTSSAKAGGGTDNGWGQSTSTCATVTSTVYSVSVSIQYVPTTTTQIETVTTTEKDYVPVTTTQVNTITTTVTETSTKVSVQPTTLVDTTTQVQVVPTTIIQTTTATVTTCSPTLTGLVTCTSRIVNPTYTPKAPLPTNYHWGCPPGTICTPPQIGCNFEQNVPAETYFCSPDECKPAPELPLPPNYNSTEGNQIDANCAWYVPVPGYFNLDPRIFGLTYAIFDIYGQPVCPAETTTITTTVGWQDWPTATPKPTTTWPPKMPRRGLWHNPLAGISARQNLNSAPPQCYTTYNYASEVGQKVGFNYPVLCPAGSDFQDAVTDCNECSARWAGDATGGSTFPLLQEYFSYCIRGGNSTTAR